MPAPLRTASLAPVGGRRAPSARCKSCGVAHRIGMRAGRGARTVRTRVALPCAWSRGGGRACGLALCPMSSSRSGGRPAQSVRCRGDAGGARRRVRCPNGVALAYWWTGSTNTGQVPLSATLIVSAVLLTLCPQVAAVWGEPLARIAVARVCRAFSHYSHAVQGGEADDLGRFVAAHAKLWASSSVGATIIVSASNGSISFGKFLKLRPVGWAARLLAGPQTRGCGLGAD